jgi:hypothetical protein
MASALTSKTPGAVGGRPFDAGFHVAPPSVLLRSGLPEPRAKA